MIEGLDRATVDWIRGDPEPPRSLRSALADRDWASIVLQYAAQHGETLTKGAILLTNDVYNETGAPDTLYEKYGPYGSEVAVTWPEPHYTQLYKALVLHDEEGEENYVEWYDAWVRYADGVAQDAYGAFKGEIERIKYGAGATTTAAQIDWDFVVRLNEYLIKNSEAGTTLEFLQNADKVMILGDTTPPTYVEAVARSARRGSIYVHSRGGLTTRGKVIVTNAADQSAFRAHLQQFSKKNIEFR